MAVGDAHVFPGFLTLVLTQFFFPRPPTTFLTCFCRGERWKYAVKKVCLNRGSNSQPPGHESDTLTTDRATRAGLCEKGRKCLSKGFSFPIIFSQRLILFPRDFRFRVNDLIPSLANICQRIDESHRVLSLLPLTDSLLSGRLWVLSPAATDQSL